MRSFAHEPLSSGPPRWSVLKKLTPFLLAYPTRVLLALALLVLAKLAGVTMPIVLANIVDSLDSSLLTLPKNALLTVPILLLLTYGCLRFFNVFLSEMRDAVFSRVSERAQSRISLDVFNHLHNLDLDFHLSRRTGGLARDIERGTRGINFLLRFGLFNILPTLLEIALVTGYLLVAYDWKYAAIALVAVVFYVLFSVTATEWRTRYVREANQMDSQTNARSTDALLNYETVKYFGNEVYESKLYSNSLERWESARLKNRLSLALLNSGQSLIIAAALTSMMYLAATQVIAGTMTLGGLVAVNAFMIGLFIPLNMLGFVYREIKASLVDIDTLLALLDVRPKVTDQANATDLTPTPQPIEFKNVSFCYHSDRPILKNISFTIAPGERVALVGRSGSGKSTIARLLFRFYDVNEGEILIGGNDVRSFTQQSLRQQMGVVPQDTVLFNDTLFHNVQYGRPGATETEVKAAMTSARLSNFVESLPDGWDTRVGERGLKISGGEKQRVAIARVLLKNPQILIFDEATSSLDSEAEQAIGKAIISVSTNHTTLVIAHRLSTTVNADRIIVLDEGVIVEQGQHNALLQNDGLYAQLWKVQQADTISG